MPGTESDELARVMGEIAEAMDARGAVLTIHPDDGRNAEILHADEEAGLGTELLRSLIARAALWPTNAHDDHHHWVDCGGEGDCRDALSIPVQRVPGHSRLIITVFFDDLTPEHRRQAETAYLRRRPFAIGYFRLWQVDRTRTRRVEALESALNLTDVGVILIDRSGALAFANAAAQAILDAGDGLRRRGTGVAGAELKENLRLQVAIDHVITVNEASGAAARRAPILTLSRRAGPPLVVSVLPTETRATEPSDVAAIAYVLDPALDTDQLLQPLCKLYQLSPVETKLVCLLTAGATLTEAADAMRIKEQSARSCLKQVFLKTDTNRQADLVRVMLSNLVRTTRAIPAEVF